MLQNWNTAEYICTTTKVRVNQLTNVVEDKIQSNFGLCLLSSFHQAKKEDIEIT